MKYQKTVKFIGLSNISVWMSNFTSSYRNKSTSLEGVNNGVIRLLDQLKRQKVSFNIEILVP